MKKIIFLSLLLSSLAGACQVTRPPVVTGELQTINIKWNSLLMYRDSLVYFRPVSNNSFQVRRPNSVYWYTYVFNADSTNQHDSVYVEWESKMKGDKDTIRTPLAYTYAVNENGDTITLIEGGTFTRNDSTFQVRKDPFCSYCWQYKYSSETVWKELYCESVSTGRILIDDNAEKILGMTYDLNIGNWRDRLFFQIDTAAKKDLIIMQRGGSVDWQPVPVDSVFFNGKWTHGGDSLNIDSDSIFYEDSWIKNGDSLKIALQRTDSLFWYAGKWVNRKDTVTIDINDADHDPTNERDTITINGSKLTNGSSLTIDINDADHDPMNERDTITINGSKLTNGSSLTVDPSKWANDTYGIYVKDAKSVGLNCSSDNYRRLKISAKALDIYAMEVNGDNAVSGAGYFISSSGVGVHSSTGGTGASIYSTAKYGTAGLFSGKTGIRTNNAIIEDSLKVNAATGRYIKRTGLFAEKDSLGINNLYNVSITSPSTDQILKYNGSKWINGTATVGSSQWTTDAYGIHYSNNVGIGIASSSSTDKLYVSSSTGNGLYATSSYNSALKAAVCAIGNGTATKGVYATSNSGIGVYGEGTVGIYGYSSTGYGVQAGGKGFNTSVGSGYYVNGSEVISSGIVANLLGLKINGIERITSTGIVKSSNGVSGSFTSADGKTVTVINGIITEIN